MPVNFENAMEVLKVIDIDDINEVISLCLGDSPLFALILEELTFSRKCDSLDFSFFEVLRFLP